MKKAKVFIFVGLLFWSFIGTANLSQAQTVKKTKYKLVKVITMGEDGSHTIEDVYVPDDCVGPGSTCWTGEVSITP